MNRTLNYAKRNLTELMRDPLGYIFCIAFPIVMLLIMSVVNESIPAESGMTTFRIDNLSGGIILFGHTFVMLFTAILVATDRGTSFLMRQRLQIRFLHLNCLFPVHFAPSLVRCRSARRSITAYVIRCACRWHNLCNRNSLERCVLQGI